MNVKIEIVWKGEEERWRGTHCKVGSSYKVLGLPHAVEELSWSGSWRRPDTDIDQSMSGSQRGYDNQWALGGVSTGFEQAQSVPGWTLLSKSHVTILNEKWKKSDFMNRECVHPRLERGAVMTVVGWEESQVFKEVLRDCARCEQLSV